MKKDILLQIEMFEEGRLSPYELIRKIKDIIEKNETKRKRPIRDGAKRQDN